MADNLTKILSLYSTYYGDKRYVYTLIPHPSLNSVSEKWLIIMEKLKSTKTNEEGKFVKNSNCAKFRANKLKIVLIININNPNISKKVIIVDENGVKVKYEVNKVISSVGYDEDINNTNSAGICYFKTITPAYYYRDRPDKYTGRWVKYFSSGLTHSEAEFNNGIECGHWIIYYESGNKHLEGDFKNGEQSGHWIEWWDSKNKRVEGDFKNGKEMGCWHRWTELGAKIAEVNYVNGVIKGKCTVWGEDGMIRLNGIYKIDPNTKTWFKWEASDLNKTKGSWIKIDKLKDLPY